MCVGGGGGGSVSENKSITVRPSDPITGDKTANESKLTHYDTVREPAHRVHILIYSRITAI